MEQTRQKGYGEAPAGVIEEVHLYRLRIPLKKPYYLSFGTMTHFETIVCELVLGGQKVLGETTPLPGYSHETADGAWAFAKEWAPAIVGLSAEDASHRLKSGAEKNPFYRALFQMALDSSRLAGYLREPGRIRAVSALHGETPTEYADEVRRLTEQGFVTLKLKVGQDLERELPYVITTLSACPPGVKLRIDANQGLGLSEAVRLWDHIDHTNLEYLEQPFPRGDWATIKNFLDRRPRARLCLDESIFTLEDIEEVKKLGRPVAVKLKYMKQGSTADFAECVDRARSLGCPITIGNGVQSDIGCLIEFALYRAFGLDLAAEFNGFAKQKTCILSEQALVLSAGEIRFTPAVNASLSPAQGILVDSFHC